MQVALEGKMGKDCKSEDDVWGMTNTHLPIILSKHFRAMDGWTNSLLIPHGKLQFTEGKKITTIIFNPKTSIQDKARATMPWLTSSCTF